MACRVREAYRVRRVYCLLHDQGAFSIRMSWQDAVVFYPRTTILVRLTDPARTIFATKPFQVYAFSCLVSFVSRDETHLAIAERLMSTVVWPHAGQHTILQPFCRGQERQAALDCGSKRYPHIGQVNCERLMFPIRSTSIPDTTIRLSGMPWA
jgi:hypothetical protein